MKKNSLFVWGLFLVVVVVFSPIFKTGFWENHDPLSPLRLYQLEKCFQDGQVPCRWAPDLGGGFGQPLFNYYAPFFYLLALVGRILGLSYLISLKAALIFLIFLSVFSVYFLFSKFFSRATAFLGAFLYSLTPFYALEIFVRGDFAELSALLLFPWILWSVYCLAQKRTWFWYLVTVISLAGFFLSHNLQLVILAPLVVLWLIYWFFKSQAKKELAGAFIFGFGLSAFFLLPAWFEKDLVQIEKLTQGYFDFRNHFVGPRLLFLKRTWGSGVSVPGGAADFSVQLGWPHWWLILFLPLSFFTKKSKN